MGVSADFDIAVLGGGAAGISASIAAAGTGKSVVICEKMPSLGKKILASGNGRCNLCNEDLSDAFYNPGARPLVRSIFSKFGKEDILNFFKRLGLQTYSDSGRIFPVTNQSSSVLKVLEIRLEKQHIPIEVNFDASDIRGTEAGFVISAKTGKHISSRSIIMASGGKSYPSFGSDGSGYKLAEKFGHKIEAPVPSAVPVAVKDPLCHLLQGQKIFASVKALTGGRIIAEAKGELLFTKYGLSGTAILDISREISIEINRKHGGKVAVLADMVPFMSETDLREEISRRIQNFDIDVIAAGILPNKFGRALHAVFKTRDAAVIAQSLKSRRFEATGTRGWNEADFTAGGVSLDDIDPGTLESRLSKGLYFAGEVLDVDGARGGYNLAWAWASGNVAGLNA